jgi:hypothetical protein
VKRRLGFIGAFVLAALGLFAQNEPHAGSIGIIGSVSSSLTSVGVNINLGEHFALRPSVDYMYYWYTPDSNSTNSPSNSQRLTPKLTGLFQFKVGPNILAGIGPYVGAEFYLSNSSSSTSETTSSSITYMGGLTFSAEYYVLKHLAIYSSFNLYYKHSGGTTTTTDGTTTDSDSYSHEYGIDAPCLGVIFELN